LILREASSTLGLRRLPMLAVGSFGVPATFGLIRPKVVLPREAEQWSDERLRVVLLHEVAHIKNADYLFNIAAQGVCALLWHNPLAWLAARQMRLERECAADDVVLATGQQQLDYAQHLFEIAQATRGNSLGASAAVAMAHHCSLKTRVAQILDPNMRRDRLSRRHLLTGSLVFFLLIAPLAAMQPQGQMSADCLKACLEKEAQCKKALPVPNCDKKATTKKNCQKRQARLEAKDKCQTKKDQVAKKPCSAK